MIAPIVFLKGARPTVRCTGSYAERSVAQQPVILNSPSDLGPRVCDALAMPLDLRIPFTIVIPPIRPRGSSHAFVTEV
jgi:hypothetical protein